MRLWVLSTFLVVACAHAQGQTAFDRPISQLKLQQMQSEIDQSKLEAQADRIQLQTQLLQLQMEREKNKEPPEKSILQIMGEYEAKKAADEAAAEVEAERIESAAVASAHSTDLIYFVVAVAMSVGFGFFIAKKVKAKGGAMKYEEKFGVLLMIIALMLGLAALSISENWAPRFDVLQNLMLTLKIRFFPETESPYSPAMVDVYTKHVLLGLLAVAMYGFTTYLGITPALKKSAVFQKLVEPPKEE